MVNQGINKTSVLCVRSQGPFCGVMKLYLIAKADMGAFGYEYFKNFLPFDKLSKAFLRIVRRLAGNAMQPSRTSRLIATIKPNGFRSLCHPFLPPRLHKLLYYRKANRPRTYFSHYASFNDALKSKLGRRCFSTQLKPLRIIKTHAEK